MVTDYVTESDSAGLAQLGLPYRPSSGVTVVADSAVCAAAIMAFNALYPPGDSTFHISEALLMAVGNNAYALTPQQNGRLLNAYIFFDSGWQVLTKLGGL